MRSLLLPLLLLAVVRPSLSAQQAMTLPDSVIDRPSGAPIRWWHAAVAAGMIGTTVLVLDAPVRRGVQEMRGNGTDDVASVFEQFGKVRTYLSVPAALTAAGLVTGDDGLTRAGARMFTAVLLSAGATQGAKRILGRRRPFAEEGATAFDLLAFDDAAFPSGHASGAFAMATSAALELRSPVASVLLYTAATGTAWSRLNDDQHWLGDVLLGAALGVTSAHLVHGRWRVFNVRPPQFLSAPNGQTAIGYSASF